MRSSLRFLSCILFLISVAVAQVNIQSFEGIDAATESGAQLDVDPNGAVGTKQYLQWVNASYQAYDKTTLAPLFPSAVQGDTPWRLAGMSNCYGTNGDGVILFDHLASRWVIGRRQGTSSYYYCIAVSNTDDLTSSTFNVYQLSLNARLGQNANLHTYFPDYPKIGTWSDGYYVSIDLLDPDLHYKPVGVSAEANRVLEVLKAEQQEDNRELDELMRAAKSASAKNESSSPRELVDSYFAAHYQSGSVIRFNMKCDDPILALVLQRRLFRA